MHQGAARLTSFGRFGGDLLVGNFGNGHINASRHADREVGGHPPPAERPPGRDRRLWAIKFGNGVPGGPRDLVFSAGLDDESHGLLVELRHVSELQRKEPAAAPPGGRRRDAFSRGILRIE
jgi:hypothetical protein